ncbi:MAG: membrane complex biogenesis BtpA family protein [Myxococcota bacterium]|jgi:membrane complex biogenesis BtpA family protein
MNAFEHRPSAAPAFLGVIHLQALPGAPLATGSFSDVLSAAMRDADALLEGGVDGLIVENLGDRPYEATTVDASTIAYMTHLAVRLRDRMDQQLLGINILRNDPIAALSIAAAVQADFIRVNVHTGTMVTDQGIISGRARETVALKRRLGVSTRIAADIAVKHASPLGELNLTQTAKDTALRACADAILVTGSGTGQPIDTALVTTVRNAIPHHPIWAASGVTPQTLPALAPLVDAVVVGTWLHADSRLDQPLDVERVRAMARFIAETANG